MRILPKGYQQYTTEKWERSKNKTVLYRICKRSTTPEEIIRGFEAYNKTFFEESGYYIIIFED